MNHPKSMFQLSGVHYRGFGRARISGFRDLVAAFGFWVRLVQLQF